MEKETLEKLLKKYNKIHMSNTGATTHKTSVENNVDNIYYEHLKDGSIIWWNGAFEDCVEKEMLNQIYMHDDEESTKMYNTVIKSYPLIDMSNIIDKFNK